MYWKSIAYMALLFLAGFGFITLAVFCYQSDLRLAAALACMPGCVALEAFARLCGAPGLGD